MMGAAGLAAGLSFLAVGLYVLFAGRTQWLDQPGHRSSHVVPTPTGAGLAMISALVIAYAIEVVVRSSPDPVDPGFSEVIPPLMGAALALSLIGLWDDLRDLSAAWRLLIQLLLSLGFVLLIPVSSPWQAGALVFALTWTMNAYNFMDGSDGLAGMQAVISGSLLAYLFNLSGEHALALASLGVAAVASGFLPWNWPPARCFMGDAGSVPLGWLLGGLCIAGGVQETLSWPAALLVLAIFHVDAGLTLLRRVCLGERWYTAHRTHVYQKLIDRGWNHRRVLMSYTALNLLIVVPAAVYVGQASQWSWTVTVIALLILVIAWCAVSLKLGGRP